MTEAYIYDAIRTPRGRGKKDGSLHTVKPLDLVVGLIDEVKDRFPNMDTNRIDDVLLGVVTPVGDQGACIAKTAALTAGLPDTVAGYQLNRFCASGLEAVNTGAQKVASGWDDLILAGGVESMSQVPIGSPVTVAKELGNPFTGEISRRYPGENFSQFVGAERMAKKYGVSKDDLDQFAYDSHRRAAAATEAGRFKQEILPVSVNLDDGGETLHDVDEGIRWDADLDAIRGLQPLAENGIISAANASQITDGASAVLVASEQAVKEFGLKPLARIHAMAVVGSDPTMVLEGPIPATEKVLKRAGMTLADIDLYEVNEALGSVPLAWMNALGADYDKLNVNGGAQALGHPLGATGAKLMGTLVYELKRRGGRYGLLAICEGLGTANATIIEVL